jgi:hypothetical protein
MGCRWRHDGFASQVYAGEEGRERVQRAGGSYEYFGEEERGRVWRRSG